MADGSLISDHGPLLRRNVRNRQIPVRRENFEAALFFFLIRLLIGPELLDE